MNDASDAFTEIKRCAIPDAVYRKNLPTHYRFRGNFGCSKLNIRKTNLYVNNRFQKYHPAIFKQFCPLENIKVMKWNVLVCIVWQGRAFVRVNMFSVLLEFQLETWVKM